MQPKVFYQWLVDQGTIVVGGKELREALYIRHDGKERQVINELRSAGRIIEKKDNRVDARAIELRMDNSCVSNDEHIIALAQISGARLLYSNDKKLHKDFGNKNLIDNPRGKVYSTLRDTGFSRSRRERLQRHVCNVSN